MADRTKSGHLFNANPDLNGLQIWIIRLIPALQFSWTLVQNKTFLGKTVCIINLNNHKSTKSIVNCSGTNHNEKQVLSNLKLTMVLLFCKNLSDACVQRHSFREIALLLFLFQDKVIF